MATAITVKTESSDYHTKVFGMFDDEEDVMDFLTHINELVMFVGYDSTCGRFDQDQISRLIEKHNSRSDG